MQEITIPLKHVGENEIGRPEDYFKIIHDDYATRYLEALGVAPTAANKAIVMRNMPLKDCELQASWVSRTSACADSITVIPRKKQGDTHAFGAPGQNAQKRGWQNAMEYINVAPPACAHEHRSFVRGRGEGAEEQEEEPGRQQVGPDDIADGMETLKQKDILASEGTNMDLTKEFELVRMAKAGAEGAKSAQVDELGEERRKRHEKELETLKRKFILPFAAERRPTESNDASPVPIGQAQHAHSAGAGASAQPWGKNEKVLVSWHSEQVKAPLVVPEQLRAELMLPIQVTLDEIRRELSKFVEAYLPLEMLTTRPTGTAGIEEVKELLTSKRTVRLIGLLSHYLYWELFGHLHHKPRRLPESSLASLYLAIHELWSQVETLYKESPRGVSFVLPVFMLTLKSGVERTFCAQYPRFADSEGSTRRQQIVDRINELFMRFFDRDCAYARFGAFDGTLRGIRLARRLQQVETSLGHSTTEKTLHRLHRATPLVAGLLEGGAADPRTRNLLQRNELTSKNSLLPKMLPASPKPTGKEIEESEAGKMKDALDPNSAEGRKKVALLRLALQRLSPAAFGQGVGGTQAAREGGAGSPALKPKRKAAASG